MDNSPNNQQQQQQNQSTSQQQNVVETSLLTPSNTPAAFSRISEGGFDTSSFCQMATIEMTRDNAESHPHVMR